MARFNPPGSGFFQTLMGGPKRVELPLGIYGKLPFYKDFLRANATGPEATAFRAWLDRGFSRFWEADAASREADLPPHGFVLHLPGTDGVVLGRMRGSHDSGGLRRFPLVLFLSQPAGKGAGRALSNLHALTQVLPALLEADRMLTNVDGVESFYARARDLVVRASVAEHDGVLDLLRGDLDGLTVAALARGMYGEAAEWLWPALLTFLGRQQASGRLAARIPVAPEPAAATQALLWTAILAGDEPRKQAPISVLLPLTEPDAGLVLVQRELRPDDALLFNPACRDYEFVEDLRRDVPGAGDPQPLPDHPLADLLPA